MNKLFTSFSKLGIVSAFLVSFFTPLSVNAEVECKINETTQFVTCYFVEESEEITQSCPMIDPTPNCVYTEWGTDDNNCPIPTETHCFGSTITPTPTPTPFSSTVYQTILGIAEEDNKHICSSEEMNEEFFFYEGERVSVCGDYIKVAPPMGLADAPDTYYSNRVNNRDSFSCNGYWAAGYQEDARCAEISSCESSEYSLCRNDAEPSFCTSEYAPVCARHTGGCGSDFNGNTFCSTPLPPATYSNICEMNKESNTQLIHEGECGTYTPAPTSFVSPEIPQNCSTWYDGCNTCGVENGQTTFCTQMACFQNESAYCMNYITPAPIFTNYPTPRPGPTFYCPTPTPLPSLSGCEVVAEPIPGASENCGASQYRYVCDVTTPPAGYEGEVITNENNPFEDTSSNTLEGQAAGFLYHNAVIGGFPDGEFKGDRFVNRAEASKFITRILYNEVENNSSSSSFWDVKSGEWYVPYVEKAAELQLIQGYPDRSFRPAKTINTAELLTIISRLNLDFDFSSASLRYSDVSSSDWFYNGALISQEYNLFPSRGTVLFPDSLVTRNELAVVLYQLLKNQNAISLHNR